MAVARFGLSAQRGQRQLKAKVFGTGSAGCSMIEGAPPPRVALSSSSSDLDRSGAERKVMLSADRLEAIASPDPSVIKRLPSIVGHELFDVFNSTELAFVMSGLGGHTGSYGSKLISAVAAAKGVPAVALVAMPFSAESARRRELAGKAIGDLLSTVTMCVVFDNDELSSLAPNMPLSRAFGLMNGIMNRPIIDTCAVLSPVDLSTLKQVFGESRLARFGLGLARGDERVERVVDEALSSPWFRKPTDEATAALAVYSAADPWDGELAKLSEKLEAKLSSAKIVWGSYADASLGERIRLSLIVSW